MNFLWPKFLMADDGETFDEEAECRTYEDDNRMRWNLVSFLEDHPNLTWCSTPDVEDVVEVLLENYVVTPKNEVSDG